MTHEEEEIGGVDIIDKLNQVRALNEAAFMAALDFPAIPAKKQCAL